MRLWCMAVIAFGLLLVGGAVPALDMPARALLELFGGHAPVVTPELRFAVGLMGAVSTGWGATLLAVATTAAELPANAAGQLWRRIGWAVLAWFLIDSAISVATGFWPNAVSNAVLLAWFWLVASRPAPVDRGRAAGA